ncbi:MAG: DUF420 domain-containing protein [Pirellulales bacterium]|jgi:uncharacterized membrane protein YozB (DUF420 family)|nr:DUF420 domain-containing protein [Pirellulales bacterium]
MSPAYSFFPAFNAGLNVLATLLLIFGYVLIKQGKEQAHKRAMLSCFGVSIVFLICYVLYHCLKGGSTEFPSYPPAAIRYIYYGILWSHILLAVYVPLGAVVTIWHGLQDNRAKHLRWAKVTFPIWLYVSVTGVVVYFMLYHLYPPRAEVEVAGVLDWTRSMICRSI